MADHWVTKSVEWLVIHLADLRESLMVVLRDNLMAELKEMRRAASWVDNLGVLTAEHLAESRVARSVATMAMLMVDWTAQC